MTPPSTCREDSYDERIPHLLRDLVGLPLTIIQLSEDAAKVASSWHPPSSALWLLPAGLHIFVGTNTSQPLPEGLVTSLDRFLATGLPACAAPAPPLAPRLSHFAPVPRPLIYALADVVLPTGHLGDLYWYYAPLPGRALCALESFGYLPDPYTEAGAVAVGYRLALEQSSALGLSRVQLLSCSSPAPLEASGEEEAATAAPLLPRASAVAWEDEGSPGFHRSLKLSLRLRLPPSSPAQACSLALLQHLPSGAYMDVYDLAAGRHDFQLTTTDASSRQRKRPRLLVHSPLAIDVEAPASRSSQHAVGVVFDGLPVTPGSRHLELSSLVLPLHLRYPAPTLNRSHPYDTVHVPAPLLLLQCAAAGEEAAAEWVLVPSEHGCPVLPLQVPAGEAWRRGVVVAATVVLSLLGVMVLAHALVRRLGRMQAEGEEEGSGPSERGSRARSSRRSGNSGSQAEEEEEESVAARALRRRRGASSKTADS